MVRAPQVVAAGLASTVAAFLTSTFGVAGTMLGAALTAMIITGGSAILRSYLENLPRGVRGLRGRPDLRENQPIAVLIRLYAGSRACRP